MKLLNYFSMVKYMICTDVKLFIFFLLSKKAGKITRNKPNFWMYHNADHYFYLVFAKKKVFLSFSVAISIWLVWMNDYQLDS